MTFLVLLKDTTITVVMDALEEPIEFLLGDLDFSGIVDFADVTLLSSFLLNSVNLNADQLAIADINGDGVIDILDIPALYELAMSSI